MTIPPSTAMKRYVSPALIAAGFSSCITVTYDAIDIISKNINVVYKFPDKNTPIVPPNVKSKKKKYLFLFL